MPNSLLVVSVYNRDQLFLISPTELFEQLSAVPKLKRRVGAWLILTSIVFLNCRVIKPPSRNNKAFELANRTTLFVQ
jgi:hypothetical protein